MGEPELVFDKTLKLSWRERIDALINGVCRLRVWDKDPGVLFVIGFPKCKPAPPPPEKVDESDVQGG